MSDSWVDEFERIYENGGLEEVAQYRSEGLYSFLNFVHNTGRSQIPKHILDKESHEDLDVDEVVQALDDYSSIVPTTRGREAEGVRFSTFDDPDEEYLLSPDGDENVYIDFEKVIREVRDDSEYVDRHKPSSAGGGSRNGRSKRK